MDDVKIPRRKAETILIKTMMASGYSKEISELGAWSALWLEDRMHPGVTSLIVYLRQIKNRPFNELSPKRHPEFGISGTCPFMLARRLISLSDKWVPQGGVALGAPAETFLMMASIADWATYRGQSVRFHHLNYTCLLSNAGIDIETDDMTYICWVDPDADRSFLIELTSDKPHACYYKGDEISLPHIRLRGNNALDLGDYLLN